MVLFSPYQRGAQRDSNPGDIFVLSPLSDTCHYPYVVSTRVQLLYVSLETYTFSCVPSFFLFSLILSFCCLAFICPLRWSKILKQHFVNCMLQRYLPILLVLLPFPHICVITYILTMLLNFWLFVCWCFVLFLLGWLVVLIWLFFAMYSYSGKRHLGGAKSHTC